MATRKPPVAINSQRVVTGLPNATSADKPVFYWDAALKGFGIKATQNSKSYIAESLVKGRTVRVKIDSCTVIDHVTARKRAMELLAAMHKGNHPNEEKRAERQRGKTFKELCEEYLEAKQLTNNTRRDYQRHTRITFAKWAEKPFLEISRDFVEKTYQEMAIRTASPAQANQAFRFARSVFNFAKRYHGEDGRPLLPDNPVNVLSEGGMWKRVAARNNYIKRTQLQAVWEGLWNPAFTNSNSHNKTVRDFLILMLFTGLRLNEARLLAWENIDLHEKTITIPDPKNHNPHTLPLSDYLIEFFKNRQAVNSKSPWVFTSVHGKEPQPIVEYRNFLNLVQGQANVNFTPHDLRRSFLTYTKELPAKYGPFFTKRLANHKVSDITAGYVQISMEELRKCMQDITDFILDNAKARQTGTGLFGPGKPVKQKAPRLVTLRDSSRIKVAQ